MQLALTSSSSDNSSASHVGRGPADSFLSSWSNHRCSSRSIASTSPTSLLLFFDPGTQLTRNEKITLCNTKKVQKSSWNEPYSSSSFTKQSCSKMALYRWIRTESRWNKKLISVSSPDWSASLRPSFERKTRPEALIGPMQWLNGNWLKYVMSLDVWISYLV